MDEIKSIPVKKDLPWVREYVALRKAKAWSEEERKLIRKSMNRKRVFPQYDRTSYPRATCCSGRSLNIQTFRKSKFTGV